MIIQCAACQARFKIADEKVTERGVKVRCTKCANTFIVRKDPAAADPLSQPAPAPVAAPAPPPAPMASPAPAPAPRSDPFAAFKTAELKPPIDPFATSRAPASGADPFAGPATSPPPAGLDLGFDPLASAPPTAATRAAAPANPFGGFEAPAQKVVDPFAAPPAPPPGLSSDFGLPSAMPPGAAPAFSPLDFGSLPAPGADPGGADGPGLELDIGDRTRPPPPDKDVFGSFGPAEEKSDAIKTVVRQVAWPSKLLEQAEAAARPSAGLDGPGIDSPGIDAPAPVPPSPAPAPAAPTAPAASTPAASAGLSRQVTSAKLSARLQHRRRAASSSLAMATCTALAGLVLLGMAVNTRLSGRARAGEREVPFSWAALSGQPLGETPVLDVRSGLFDTQAGHPVFYVRGRVLNRASERRGPLAVTVELKRGGTTARMARGWVGAVATPEEVWAVSSPESLQRMEERMREGARAIDPGASAEFLAVFYEYPDDLTAHEVSAFAETLAAPARRPEAGR